MADEKPKKPNSLHAEWRTDYEAARLRDTGQDYEKHLRDAAERAPSKAARDKERTR